tara:strand:+ start:703 stop:1233 length:531 start_codon:yes stop_codon:yes gene_type:complete
MSDLDRSLLIEKILWEWDALSESEFETISKGLPRKIVRWLAMSHPDNRSRKTLLRLSGVSIGCDAVINHGIVIEDNYESRVEIGARASIACGVQLLAISSPNNSVLTESKSGEKMIKSSHVIVGQDAWIGAGAILLPGVEIGNRAVVASGAVVTRSCKSDVVVSGVPAREMKEIYF